MHRLSTRLTRLEHSAMASGAFPPWKLPRWQWLSETAKASAIERYVDTLSDSELEELLAAAEALACDTPHRSRAWLGS
jgi:hypothetical protein